MDCPRDNTEMTVLSEGEERVLFRCAECGGLWLDVADLNRILLHAGLPTLEAMGGRANPEEDAGECPVDNVGLLAVQSQHKRNPLTYETCESCGGIWLESGDFLRIEVTVPVELEVRALSDGALLWSKRTQFVRDLSLHLGERPAPAEVPDGGDDGGFFHLPEPAGYYLVLKSRTAGAYTLTAAIESGPPDIEQE